MSGLHKPQSEIDKARAEAVANLNDSLNEISSAAIQIGSILYIKTTDDNGKAHLQVRTLSSKEQIYLENNLHLLSRPESLMQSLSQESLLGDDSQESNKVKVEA